MKVSRIMVMILAVASMWCNVQPVRSQDGVLEDRAQWFADARFGMFIHWGLYSAAEGIWKGERFRHFNNYAEWIMYRNAIPMDEYVGLADRFVWERIDPEEWVLAAKRAGMKYIIITAKHHDGIAIWDSQVSAFSPPKLAKIDRDPIAELAEACRKHDMKLGFYYSHWIDWEHRYGWTHNRELTGATTNAQYDQYWQEKVVPQLRELLTNYGDVALLWFDMWISHEETVVTRAQIDQVVALVRELQPNCLINSRLGIPITDPNIDFETLGDNRFGTVYRDHPWETPGTIAHSWGYNALENQWKSTNQLLQSLISNASLNGGYTLNIGPRADGSIPYESIRRLEDMGDWLGRHGQAIYGSSGLELRAVQHDWGRITYGEEAGKSRVYLHVFNWPLDGKLRVSGMLTPPSRAFLLDDTAQSPLALNQAGPYMEIDLAGRSSDPFVSVVVLEFERMPALDRDVVGESAFGGLSLQSTNVMDVKGTPVSKWYDGRRPDHFVVAEPTTLVWRVYVRRPTTLDVDLSYSMQGKENAEIIFESGNNHLTGQLEHTGQMVMEPNTGEYTDRFEERPLGKVVLDQAGYHDIILKLTPGSDAPLLFNWLWLE